MSEDVIDLVQPPMAGVTDMKVRGDAKLMIDAMGARAAFSEIDVEYFECYAVNPGRAYEMFWLRCHIADLGGIKLGNEENASRLAMGVGAPVEVTGTLARSESGLVLRLEGGGEYRLSDQALSEDAFGEGMRIRGLRSGYDLISSWRLAT